MNHYGLVIWITGLAGSGKTTISKELYYLIKQDIPNVVYLDGDGFREIFECSKHDKDSRIKVAMIRARMCNLLSKQGIVVIASTISLFQEIYENNKKIFKNYIEVYIQCDMQELINRDQKQLYTNALNGKIKDVVGIDIKFDTPKSHLTIDNNERNNAGAKAANILRYIKDKKIPYMKERYEK